jgi:hypothetical protein
MTRWSEPHRDRVETGMSKTRLGERTGSLGVRTGSLGLALALAGSLVPAHGLGAEPASEAAGEATIEVGPGPFDLPDPTVALADLPTYIATLTASFDGTVAGAPSSGSSTATMRVSPAGRELTIEREPDGSSTWRADIDGFAFTKEGDEPCAVRAIGEGESIAEMYEPASQLGSITGAEEAGTERVGGVATSHYTFDERSLFLPYVARGSGDAWIAETDGHLVRYRQSLEVGPDVLGQDVTGTQTLEYELSIPKKAPAIELPADCPALIDAPVLAGATDVARVPGITSFTSKTSLAKAAKAYAKAMKAKGWKGSGKPDVTTSGVLMSFRKGKTDLTVIMRLESGSVDVRVVAAP